ncbi:MAG: 4Fe-4S double cluster binding domain-containing protein [Nitrososphaeria archaeon]
MDSNYLNYLENLAKSLGANVFGAADISSALDFVCEQGGQHLRKFSYGISIGIRLLDSIVDELHRRDEATVFYTYRALYNTVNARLDQIAFTLAKYIQDKGYLAYPVPASQIIDQNKLIGVISHKLVANLAGLGWIGKNCLPITPKYGPRVRLASILTNMPLYAGTPVENRCGECNMCVQACPAKAFTGVSFRPEEPREKRFNAQLCYKYQREREAKIGDSLCGMCVYICPYGRRLSK